MRPSVAILPLRRKETGTETNTAAQAARGRDGSDSALRKEPQGEHPKSEVIVNEEKGTAPGRTHKALSPVPAEGYGTKRTLS